MLQKHDARTSSKTICSVQVTGRSRLAICVLTGAAVVAGVMGASRVAAQPADLLPILAASQQQPMGNRDRLQRGITEFQNGQYEEALADLQQVRGDELAPVDRERLTDYLNRADQAAAQRKSARAEFELGERALAGSQPTEASAHYQAAINNRFADEGTRAKSREQLAVAQSMMRQTGQSMKGLYDQAVTEFRAGQLEPAKAKFQQLTAADYRPGLFQRSPADYVKDIDARLATTAQPTTPAPTPATPAPAAEPRVDGRAVYQAAVQQFNAGDLAGAKANFQRAKDAGYRGGLFQDSPDRYLARIADREREAEAIARQQAEVAATAAAIEAERQRAAAAAAAQPTTPPPAPVTQVPVIPAPAPTTPPPVVDTPPAPPPVATLPPPEPRPDPRQVYLQARRQFDSGDLLAAKKNFELARELAYRPGLFEESPDRYLTRINERIAREELAQRQQNVAIGAAVQVQPAGEAAQPNALDIQVQVNQQTRDYVTFSFRDNLAAARTAQGAGQFDDAQAAIERARVARNVNPGVFTPGELQAFDRDLAQAQTALDGARANARRVAEQEAQAGLAAAAAEADRIAQEERRRTVADLIAQANQMIGDGKYDQAVSVIDHILTLDPKNEWAIQARPLVDDRAVIRNQRDSRERFNSSVVRQFNLAEEAKIPYSDILRFPDNWPDLTERRDRTVAVERGVRSEDVVVIAQLDRNLPEVRFEANGFAEVVDFLRDVSGANIFVNWRALETAGVDRAAPVTARLRDVKFSKALETILRDVGGGAVRLGYTVDEGVISISTEEDLASNTVTNVYDIQDLITNVTDFDQPPTFNIQGSTAGGGGGGGNLFGNIGQQQAQNNTRQALVDSIMLLIQDTVARESWRDNGGNVGSIRELAGQLIVTQTPENQRQLVRLLDQLRETRALQITVETRFLTVQRNFMEEIGVDFDFVLNPNGQLSSRLSPITVGTNTEAYTTISNLATNVPGNIATELVGTSSSATGVTPNFGITGINGGAVTFLDDFQVSILLRATQIQQSTTVLTAPRLTLFNGQRAFVVVATETAYVSDLTPIVGTNAVAFDPQVGIVQSGVLLDVQATVSSDRKYVTMTLRPTLTRLRALVPFPVSAISNTPIIGEGGQPTTIVQAFIQQPVQDITTINTTVSVPDGGTLLLGGQTLAGEIERTSGVPVLSKIPFLKRLFTNTSMAKDEQILLILVKPTVVIQREREQDQFPVLGSRVGG